MIQWDAFLSQVFWFSLSGLQHSTLLNLKNNLCEYSGSETTVTEFKKHVFTQRSENVRHKLGLQIEQKTEGKCTHFTHLRPGLSSTESKITELFGGKEVIISRLNDLHDFKSCFKILQLPLQKTSECIYIIL